MLWNAAFVFSSPMLILFHLDSLLCSVSPSSRTPTPGADQVQGDDVGHDPHVSAGEVALSSGAPTPVRAAAAGAAALETPEVVASDGSPVPSPGMTTAMGTIDAILIASSVGVSSPQSQMARPPPWRLLVMTSWRCPKWSKGTPFSGAPGDVSLDEAMGMAHWELHQVQGVLR
jgi:hypothetical protein